jgi:hypothetical protein
MDSRSKFRPRLQRVNNDRGTQKQSASGLVDWSFNSVGQPRLEYERAGQPNLESRGVGWQEKLCSGMLQTSVP